MQEEVENKTVQLAVRSSKVTLKLLLRALRAYIRHHQNKKRLKQYAKSKDATVKGNQSIFFGVLKQEMYYGNTYYSFEELKETIEKYIVYYNEKRIKEKLGWMSPVEYRLSAMAA